MVIPESYSRAAQGVLMMPWFYVHTKSVGLLVWQEGGVKKDKAKFHHLYDFPRSGRILKVTM